ncbi:MAG: HAD-IC family P-type ATPase [Methanothrix sp.]|nr:HAD-IC family P-type ATPase [Methanothrix sp.]
MTAEEVLESLGSCPAGLDARTAEGILAARGRNVLESKTRPSPLRIFLRQFKEYLVLVLAFAALVSVLAGESTNAYVISGIVLLVATIGFLQEYRAERAMEALREMVSPEADVMREGVMVSLPASEIVPGDVIYLEAGDRVPADGRIIEERSLEVIEATLTGESMPVKKDTAHLPEETPLAERRCMVFMGTMVSYGNCRAVVTATGSDTELGRISQLITQKQAEPPLKVKLGQLAKRQALLVLVVSVAVFSLDLSRGSPLLDTLVTAIALAVAGVPEALPFVVTLALALGTQVMAKKNAIIRSLPAVETLGSTTVICTDKTGTLTTGEMTVREIQTFRPIQVTGSGYDPLGEFLEDGRRADPCSRDLAQILKLGILCNNADVDREGRVIGDPTEAALIVAARKAGLLEEVRAGYTEVVEYPFDSERKRMTTVHRSSDGSILVSMKGAPEVILDRCSYFLGREGVRRVTREDRRAIRDAADGMAERAMRVLAFAWKPLSEGDSLDMGFVESDLIFAGLTGMMDPPRPEALEAVGRCRDAGIRTIMITGDHRLTARAIARELGMGHGGVIEGSEIDGMSDSDLQARIEEVSVFARVTAEHKVRIVGALKEKGNIVAMTGDGVNDAPALRAADIGVAMGRAGTEVAKEAASMVVLDDNFATIVGAIEEGRRIYDNIRKSASYLLSVSFSEVATIFLGVMLGLPVPLLAVQILWINIVAEEFPAIGLAVEPAQPDIMRKRPRDPAEPILSRQVTARTLGVSAAMVAGSLGLYISALNAGEDLGYARTMAFLGLGLFTVLSAYSSRSLERSVLEMSPAGNLKLAGGMIASLLSLLAAVYVPLMQQAFGTVPLRPESWWPILAASLMVLFVSEALKRVSPSA